ncbi:MAG: M17 family peptidase N-terminal domain-containing protein [Phenylobacterium sp.]|uniref:leucyl aminopeptidase family protein n=1 Tax=Phenylobacterium sp. TaxID=1871053 RepID=UPI0027270E89|nr:M17 family peptidase N-terminal domain-containing protein [Phenylobacterium sp.]MDO8902869.1 M17 family peptidase N-terminal domain-containing protein [Phenylobacterium sp.]
MSDVILDAAEGVIIPVHLLREADVDAALAALTNQGRGLAALHEFKGKAGQVLLVPDAHGATERVLFGLGQARASGVRALAAKLPKGNYEIVEGPTDISADEAALAFALGSYRFDRYKKKPDERPRLVARGADVAAVRAMAHACALARDMINTPPNDMGPLQIETIAREIAEQHGAAITVVTGEGLLEANYPAVHAVGRAAAAGREPRMIEMTWGKASDPLVAIIGKGVVFDTGGLDIKPSAGMRLMKKDMGGAAHALALARMVMAAGLAVRLLVLTPTVENSISGEAMRPGDVIDSRKGLTIEVGNTDAEGRLILADALTRAAEFSPDLTLDLATLTGAARVALGPQLPPFMTDDEELAAAIMAASEAVEDPLWRLPLWKGYAEALDSDVADLKNDPDAWAQAGAVTAGLFLQRFAPEGAWAHLDIFAWNPRAKPGVPAGGEVMAIRALFRMLQDRYK